MARTAITVTALSKGAVVADAHTDIDATNGMVIAAADVSERLHLRVLNTYAGNKTFTIKAGAWPSMRKGLGDLASGNIAQDASVDIEIETGRFVQADGTINIDFAASTTGEVRCWKVLH